MEPWFAHFLRETLAKLGNRIPFSVSENFSSCMRISLEELLPDSTVLQLRSQSSLACYAVSRGIFIRESDGVAGFA